MERFNREALKNRLNTLEAKRQVAVGDGTDIPDACLAVPDFIEAVTANILTDNGPDWTNEEIEEIFSEVSKYEEAMSK